MQNKSFSIPLWMSCSLMLLISVACDRDPMIRVYEVDVRKPSPNQSQPTVATAAPKRMIGAMIPAGEQSIFLKMTGDPDTLAKHYDAMKTAAQSATLTAAGEVDLQVPEGWKKAAGTSMAIMTLVPPEMEGVDAPMTVTVLPGMTDLDAWKDYAQQNLDRWRGQLGLSPVALDEDLKSDVESVTTKGNELPTYLVNYVGTSSGKPSMPPFASGMSSSASPGSGAPAKTTQPAPTPAANNEQTAKVKFELPEGWVDQSGQGSPIRLATLRTGSAEDAAEVSVVMAGGEERTIVELWAQSVLGPEGTNEESINEVISSAKPITSKTNVSGKLYKIVPKDSSSPDAQAILVAVFPIDNSSGERSLFAKLTGLVEQVNSNETKFDAFVQSLNWQ